ncbi:MAG: peptidylprolyl isomerase [Rhodobacterales bacterium 17-64-5]|nr:MAG: peptidylprolyl isomerase [Rhodobacterales bacterium 17-64-5]
MPDIKDPENTIILTLKDGDVVIELLADVAPKHTERMKQLARDKAYDNVAFHRVIDGFMAQTGDVRYGKAGGDLSYAGTGDSDLPNIPAEFSNDLSFQRGVVGMARAADPDSANSQFFIMFAPGEFLDGQYTIVGNVISGMDVVDAIQRGEPPGTPDVMTRVSVQQ